MSLKKPPGAWALNYVACVRCGKSDTKHMGKGLCRRCYFTDYNEENKKEIQGYKRKWYLANMTPEIQKLIREQGNFSGWRETVLKRDGYRCVKCGTARQLCVHHKDGKGRSVPTALKNNSLQNLETCCRACHLDIHRSEIFAAKRANQSKWWAPTYKLAACIECNRSDRKHQSGGRCATCAERFRTKLRKEARRV